MSVDNFDQVLMQPERPRGPKPIPGSQQPILHVDSTGVVCISELRGAAAAN